MRAHRILLIGAGAAVALLAARAAQAASVDAAEPAPAGIAWPDFGAGLGAFSLGPVEVPAASVNTAQPAQAWAGAGGMDWQTIDQWSEGATVQQASSADNVQAFLACIAWAEGTSRAADPYRVCYGYRHTVQDLSEHPAVSGEWAGEKLDNLGARYVGKISTAAGRYQFTAPTWKDARAALGLQDFGPASQDAAAVWLIRKCGALEAVQAGELQRAAKLCAAKWASLPDSTAGQPTRRIEQLAAAYTQAGGVLA